MCLFLKDNYEKWHPFSIKNGHSCVTGAQIIRLYLYTLKDFVRHVRNNLIASVFEIVIESDFMILTLRLSPFPLTSLIPLMVTFLTFPFVSKVSDILF